MIGKRVLVSAAILCALVGTSYAGEICMSEETASKVVVELEQKRVMEQELRAQEELIANLRKQVDLLKQENALLREQVALLKEQRDTYKILSDEKDKELRREKVGSWFKGTKAFGIGTVVGAVVVLLIGL
jgi:predicted phage tail protein